MSLRFATRPAATALVTFCMMAMFPAAQTGGASCNDWLSRGREALGKKVGPVSCLMIEADGTLDSRAFKRIDIGLSGTVEGYLTKTGDYKEYLTNAPDLVFPQTADAGPVHLAVASYERDKGASITLVFPSARSAWNGKLWVMAHGRGQSFKEGNLRAWDRYLDRADVVRGLDRYDQLLLSKGYAVAKTRRTSSEGLGEIIATLDDGTTVDYPAFNDSHRYIMDFATVAENALQRRLGRAPVLTYFYGHSAGARIGRGLNYTRGLNKRADGRPFFAGILADDGAAGGWLPVHMKDGKDVLLTSDADKAAFVPQIDITHQMYNNIWPSKKPSWMSASFLENKRNNARVLRDKGLTPKHRMYEVRSISHAAGGAGLDLANMMDKFIDLLDAWVEKGTAPPPSRSDWPELGDPNRDGVIEFPGLSFPEVACPLGVWYPTTSTSGSIDFVAFTGQGLEPLDRNQVFIDMNRNGVWDYRETPTAAWRRLGLLQRTQELTREKYVACVKAAAEELRSNGFYAERTAAAAVERATKADLQPSKP